MKAQSSIEYVFLVGAALLFVALVFSVARVQLFGSAENQVDVTSNNVIGSLNTTPILVTEGPPPTSTPLPLPS